MSPATELKSLGQTVWFLEAAAAVRLDQQWFTVLPLRLNLTLAHLRIGHMEGNPEVGNSEYMGHQDCPPQLVCFWWHNTGPGYCSEDVGSVFHHDNNNLLTKMRIQNSEIDALHEMFICQNGKSQSAKQ